MGNVQGILGSSANTTPAPPAPAPQIRVADLKQPRLLSTVRPVYPPAATQAGIEGSVVISAVIDEAGRVTNTKVISGANVLRSAALDAVSKWRYQPAVSNGKPIATQLNITLEFRLH
jgi:periplasmic protein TonB